MDISTETETQSSTENNERDADMEVLDLLCERYNLKTTSPENVCLWPSTIVQIKNNLMTLYKMLGHTNHPFDAVASNMMQDIQVVLDTIDHAIEKGK